MSRVAQLQAGPPENDNEFLDTLMALRSSKRFPNPLPRRLAGDVRLKRHSASRAALAPGPFTTRMSPGADAHRLASDFMAGGSPACFKLGAQHKKLRTDIESGNDVVLV